MSADKTHLNSIKAYNTILNSSATNNLDFDRNLNDTSLAGRIVLNRWRLLRSISNDSGEALVWLAEDTQKDPSVSSCDNIANAANRYSGNSDKELTFCGDNASINKVLSHVKAETQVTKLQNTDDPDSLVVIKIYRRQNAIKEEILNKLCSLKSPYIVEILDHGLFEDRQCIVMPYLVNGSLAGKTLDYEIIKSVVIPDVCAGLKFLYENKILHKDIKPGNLMISNDGKHILIIDFGISSVKDDGLSIIRTKTGQSPEYSAPETFNNIWVSESDYYSLGITLYELFKGYTPFHRPASVNSHDLRSSQEEITSDPTILTDEIIAGASIQKISFSPDFPPEFQNLIKGLTYKDLTFRKDRNNVNRRWTWCEIEKWCNNEFIAVPGESETSIGGETSSTSIPSNWTDKSSGSFSNSPSTTKPFSSPYEFVDKNNQQHLLWDPIELADALGTNWAEGKKRVGRGLLTRFLRQQDQPNFINMVMDCEEENITNEAYSKMLTRMQMNSQRKTFYWEDTKYDDPESLCILLQQLLENSSIDSKQTVEAKSETIRALKFFSNVLLTGDNKNGDKVPKGATWTETSHPLGENTRCGHKTIDRICDLIRHVDEHLKEIERTRNARVQRDLNPVLTGPEDITDEVIDSIITGKYESITLDYQFTRTIRYEETPEEYDRWRVSNNPFVAANRRHAIENIDLEIRLGKGVTSLDGAFADLKKLKRVNIADTSGVTSMSRMFAGASNFNHDISSWNTSNVTDMSCMFYEAKSFNQPLENWDTSNVIFMLCMFLRAKSFNQPLERWNTSKVTDMSLMFFEAESFNQPLDGWDTSSLKNARDIVTGAKAFRYQPPHPATFRRLR